MRGVAALTITLQEKRMASDRPDHNPHADQGRSHHVLPRRPQDAAISNHQQSVTRLACKSTESAAGAAPRLGCQVDDCLRAVPENPSNSSTGGESDRQQRTSLVDRTRNASGSCESTEHSNPSSAPNPSASTTANCAQIPSEEFRSKPIPIAVPRKKPKHTGLTPLSGRPWPTYVADGTLSSRCVRSRTPSPSSSFHTHYSTPITALSLDRHPYRMSSRPSQSSPLSPVAPSQPMMIPRRRENPLSGDEPQSRPKSSSRPAAQKLNLTGLPKYHPANFPTSSDNSPLSPQSIQALNTTNSKRNTRPGSDAQHALHKYQRETITRASGLVELAKPTSPRLIPEGSPAGSMTPLALEAQSDYLLSASNLPANAADARKVVDQILQKENEERDHPDTRSTGSQSPAVTPPV